MKVLIILFLTCCSIAVFAQHKYDWKKYDSLPFKEDSIQIPSFEKDVLASIKKSRASIEMRSYFNGHGYCSILRLQCFKDLIIGERYYRVVGDMPVPILKEDSIFI